MGLQPTRDGGVPSTRPFGGHGFTHDGYDLAGEELDLPLAILGWPVDEGVHPGLQGETQNLLDPQRDGTNNAAFALGADPARTVAIVLARGTEELCNGPLE